MSLDHNLVAAFTADQTSGSYFRNIAGTTANASLNIFSEDSIEASYGGAAALRIDGTFGTSEWLTLSSAIDVPADAALCASFWMYPTSSFGSNPGFLRDGSSSNGGNFFIFDGSNRRPWIRRNGANVLGNGLTGHQFDLDRWQHFVFCVDNTRAHFYTDGILRHSATHAQSSSAFTVNNLIRQAANERYLGWYDDIRIYVGRFISEAEISTLAIRRGIAHEQRRVTRYRAGGGGGTTVTPTTASLTLTTYAPTVSTPVVVTPSTASLTITAYAPTIALPVVATPDAAALTLTTYAPSIATPVTATPGTSSLTLTTYAPTVTAGGSVEVVPGTASLTLTTYAPTVTAGGAVEVTPTTAGLTLTPYAPSVLTPVTVTPTTASLTLTGLAPEVRLPVVVTPATLALILQPYAPSVVNPVTVTPTTASLTLTTYAPSINPGDGSLIFQYYTHILAG